MNASEKLEDQKKNSSKNECRKSKISIVQYSELLLKSKHKPFAASARRETDTLPFKDAVHSQGSASTKSSADDIYACFCFRMSSYFLNLLAIFNASMHKGHFNLRERKSFLK